MSVKISRQWQQHNISTCSLHIVLTAYRTFKMSELSVMPRKLHNAILRASPIFQSQFQDKESSIPSPHYALLKK